MGTFVYEGPSEQLYLCVGRRTAALTRGVPTELDGAAAEAAAGHPQVSEADDGEPTPAQVRAWARENDIEVPARGALKPELVEQYKAAMRG